jgi:hypothetical protein
MVDPMTDALQERAVDTAMVQVGEELQQQIDLMQIEEAVAIKTGMTIQEWYLKKLAEADMAEELIKERGKVLLNQVENGRKALAYCFGAEFRAAVEADLESQGGTKKSVDYHTGRAGFRMGRDKLDLVITDEAEAMAFCQENDLVDIKASVTKMKKHYKDTGEIPDGVEVIETPAENKFFPAVERLELTDG